MTVQQALEAAAQIAIEDCTDAGERIAARIQRLARRHTEDAGAPGEPDDDGERTDCGGCGESWNASESDAKNPGAYCSATCEANDTEDADDTDAHDEWCNCPTCIEDHAARLIEGE